MPQTEPLGVTTVATIFQKVFLQPTVGTAGSDGGNNYLFEVLKNATTVMFSKNTNGNEMTANAKYELTPQGLAARTAVAETPFQLRVTKTGNPTDLSGATISVTVDANKDLGVS